MPDDLSDLCRRDTPWLSIPAHEYDEHMADPAVGQRAFLDHVFARTLAKHKPRSIALPGCATGGGLDLIAHDQCERVTAIEINPEYIRLARTRYVARLPQLELIEADIESCDLEADAYDLVHCALVLEYVDPEIVLTKAVRWLSKRGVLVVVLQLPSDDVAALTPTRFESLQLLLPIIKLHEPETIRRLATRVGLVEREFSIDRLDSGKQFYVAVFSHAMQPPQAEG